MDYPSEISVANARLPEQKDAPQTPLTVFTNVGDQERWVSVAAGLLLTVSGLLRRSIGSVGVVLAGLYLVYRGASGHCYGYQALGINRAYGDNQEFLSESDFSNVPPTSVTDDAVSEASWESFPTSDPPSWTLGREER